MKNSEPDIEQNVYIIRKYVKYLLWYFEKWAKQFFIQFSFLQIYLRWKSVESRVYNSYVFKNITYMRSVCNFWREYARWGLKSVDEISKSIWSRTVNQACYFLKDTKVLTREYTHEKK